jgi:6 kDa early secretory antigenic target
MTGMGFDGLVVNHGGLNEITDQLYKMVKDIDDRMNRLESDLSPLASDWSGEAQGAYVTAKTKWDTAINEMMTLLNDVGRTVNDSNVEYQNADKRGANAFQIG